MARNYNESLDVKLIQETLSHKNKENLTIYRTIDDFFDPTNLERVQGDWDQWLAPMINPLPSYLQVISELKRELELILRK
jgi:hypothetical protein